MGFDSTDTTPVALPLATSLVVHLGLLLPEGRLEVDSLNTDPAEVDEVDEVDEVTARRTAAVS